MPGSQLSIIIISVAGAMAWLVSSRILNRIWPREGKWGMNSSPIRSCPHCNAPTPRWRMPANWRQAMWGGWTCSQCGHEFDKYGKAISDESGEV
jgi:hypothetical protein